MHTCSTCGQEFDGNFCPNCGTKRQEETTCPVCGTKASCDMRYCSNCGQQLTDTLPSNQWPTRRQSTAIRSSSALSTFYSCLPYLPATLFALFSALCFLFFLAPVTTVLGLSNSLYDWIKNGAQISAQITNLCIGMLAFAAFGTLFGIALLVIQSYIPLRVKTFMLGTHQIRIWRFLSYFTIPFYAIPMTLSSVLIDGIQKKLFIEAGDALICIIVFASLFLLFTLGAWVGRFLIGKVYPEIPAECTRKIADAQARMGEPLPPTGGSAKRPEYSPIEPLSEKLKKKIEKFTQQKRAITVLTFLWYIGMLFSGISESIILYSVNNDATVFRSKLNILIIIFIISSIIFIIGVFVSLFIRYAKLKNFSLESIYMRRVAKVNITLSPLILFISIFLDLSPIILIIFFLNLFVLIKSRRLCLKVYGVSHPEKVPQLQEQYEKDFTEYRLHKPEWRIYNRKLAYYTEGKQCP